MGYRLHNNLSLLKKISICVLFYTFLSHYLKPILRNLWNGFGSLTYLSHVRECEVGLGVFLVLLNDLQEPGFPLFHHFKLGVIPGIVVERKGEDEGFRGGVVFI